jgi:hypothetical protein
MSFKAKDGKSFGNRQKQKAYDEREPKQDAAKESPKDESNSPTAQPEEATDDGDINSFVAQNGPADEITMKHNDDTGEHDVESTHGGKKHKSKHASRDEAHMHAAQAAGLQPPQEQAPAASQQPMQQPMAIPGLG